MKTTVVFHRADYDGLFCREIARKFLPDAELIGWDFGDTPLAIPPDGPIYILDLPVDRVFERVFNNMAANNKVIPQFSRDEIKRVIWIDHHKSSIETHPIDIPGYRIDGVAACRLAWQWFKIGSGPDTTNLPDKSDYIERKVVEPLAVCWVGEYDVWDKRNPKAELFQFGLRSRELTAEDWLDLLASLPYYARLTHDLVDSGEILQRYQQQNDASVVNHQSFLSEFDGLKFLVLNTARCNSLTFAAKDVPETGHDALMGVSWDGKSWKVSLYHAKHRTDLDLSAIAVKYGGGGHRGACGFQADTGWMLGMQLLK